MDVGDKKALSDIWRRFHASLLRPQ